MDFRSVDESAEIGGKNVNPQETHNVPLTLLLYPTSKVTVCQKNIPLGWIQDSIIQLGMLHLPVTVGSKGYNQESLLKKYHDPGGNWHPARGFTSQNVKKNM